MQWYLQSDQRTVQPSHPYVAGADVNAPLAWSQSLGSETTKVAVIDSGIDEGHPDLAGRVDALYTHIDNSGSVLDQTGHGTFVAGLIAANWDNALGIGGVAPRAGLVIVKATVGASTTMTTEAMASAIGVAADAGAEVINISYGSTTNSFALFEAVLNATSDGAVVVASAGNDGTSTPMYPANTSFALSVAATDNQDRRATFSTFGDWVDIAAPGAAIVSTVPTYPTVGFGTQTHYAVGDGTSFAAPLVSGAAALIWESVASTSSSPQHAVPARLEVTADRVPGTGTYWRYGRLNACQALAYLAANCPRRVTTPPTAPQEQPAAPTQSPTTRSGTYRRRLAPRIYAVMKPNNRLVRFAVRPVLKCGGGRGIGRRVRMVTGRGITVPTSGRFRLSTSVRTAGPLHQLKVIVRGRFADNRLTGNVRASAIRRKSGKRCTTHKFWSIKRST
jgi:thermitase